MAYYDAQEFALLRERLSEVLQSAAAKFAKENGLDELSESSLRQMNTSIDQISSEILFFGCNAWPESARSDALGYMIEAIAS